MQRGLDELDLDTLSQVSQLRSGFHGVNGTAAVSLTRELHAGSLTKFFYIPSAGVVKDTGEAEART